MSIWQSQESCFKEKKEHFFFIRRFSKAAKIVRKMELINCTKNYLRVNNTRALLSHDPFSTWSHLTWDKNGRHSSLASYSRHDKMVLRTKKGKKKIKVRSLSWANSLERNCATNAMDTCKRAPWQRKTRRTATLACDLTKCKMWGTDFFFSFLARQLLTGGIGNARRDGQEIERDSGTTNF
jgi:hypothetical protein